MYNVKVQIELIIVPLAFRIEVFQRQLKHRWRINDPAISLTRAAGPCGNWLLPHCEDITVSPVRFYQTAQQQTSTELLTFLPKTAPWQAAQFAKAGPRLSD